MATEVKLPEIGEGVTEGELVKWLVKVGDKVQADQPVAEVMTDKATVEVPTPQGGIVKEFRFSEGDVIEVEKVMMVLEGGGAAAKPGKESKAEEPDYAAARPEDEAKVQGSSLKETQGGPVQRAEVAQRQGQATSEIEPPVADSKVLATPSTRRYARELGVDINQIQGSGLAGRVTREDVEKQGGGGAKEAPSTQQAFQIPRPSYHSAQGAQEERVPLRGIRKKIAENMQMAKHIVPHFTLMDEANVTKLVDFRASLKSMAEERGIKITYLPFVMKALIATAREFPMFNASIDDEAKEIVYKKYFNIGFAADTPNGLMVPVIRSAEQKSILEISAEILDLAGRARDGKLKPEEMKGATITVTNIGSIGGSYATPIINHPEVAILGMYKISDKPVIENGELNVIKSMNFTITADHRLIDGAVAARFLSSFIKRIEEPGVLMMDMV